MRPDGKRVKDLPPIVAAIPYIMPKRYDAQNTITENIDEELIKEYIRTKRREGMRINHMAVIIAAYYINSGKTYQRRGRRKKEKPRFIGVFCYLTTE